MAHSTYRGKIVYLTDGVGEEGREYFTVTVQPDGSRTLRAQCEMDNDGLLRDVIYSLDGQWQPEECFVRLTIGGKFQGSAVFRFTDTRRGFVRLKCCWHMVRSTSTFDYGLCGYLGHKQPKWRLACRLPNPHLPRR